MDGILSHMEPTWIKLNQASELLNVHASTVSRWGQEGALRKVRRQDDLYNLEDLRSLGDDASARRKFTNEVITCPKNSHGPECICAGTGEIWIDGEMTGYGQSHEEEGSRKTLNRLIGAAFIVFTIGAFITLLGPSMTGEFAASVSKNFQTGETRAEHAKSMESAGLMVCYLGLCLGSFALLQFIKIKVTGHKPNKNIQIWSLKYKPAFKEAHDDPGWRSKTVSISSGQRPEKSL